MFLGELIKQYRTKNEMSQRDFAKLCNLSHTYIAALEKNIDSRTGRPIAPTLDTIKYVANAMNISAENVLHLLENEQYFNLQNESQLSNNCDYTSYEIVDTEGLDKSDIEEIKRFVEFLKDKKNIKK